MMTVAILYTIVDSDNTGKAETSFPLSHMSLAFSGIYSST